MTMASIKIREPSSFSETKDEDSSDWLAQYQMISSINGWQNRRLDFCVLYLIIEAKFCSEIREPASWAPPRGLVPETVPERVQKSRYLRSARGGAEKQTPGAKQGSSPIFLYHVNFDEKIRNGNR